ncbi:hypothetical protein E4K72_07735 [Oxalobacteraceae bacterium OM1]|nr:hypothetical protein E4K72_07735 [Oxalobacteraceae bacterium OM1]
MQAASNPLAMLVQAQLEVSRRCADAVFSGTEKLDRMMIEAAQRAISNQLRLAKSLAANGNPGQAMSEPLGPSPAELSNYQTQFVQVLVEMQNDIGRSWQDYLQQLGAPVRDAAPADPGPTTDGHSVPDPVTGMFSLWQSAFQEAASLAQRNMDGARAAMESAGTSGADLAAAAARNASAALNGERRAKRKSA